MPILIDEAYHHFVDDPAYGTSLPYVLEGRPVIIARTFSKIAALAAMRIGYAVSTPEIIKRMRPFSMGSVNVLAKWGAAASLKDTAGQADVKAKVTNLRNKTTRELEAYGYPVIPSQTNFFMVSLEGRTVQPVIEEFRTKGILVGRPFPPMLQHLRVSVGVPEEMDRFMKGVQGDLPQEGLDDDGARIARNHVAGSAMADPVTPEPADDLPPSPAAASPLNVRVPVAGPASAKLISDRNSSASPSRLPRRNT